jgi:hypothetical protein
MVHQSENEKIPVRISVLEGAADFFHPEMGKS